MKKLDFTSFIQQHDEAILGKKKNIKGQLTVFAYRKQIAALDMKMNEVIQKGDARAKDPNFLLGLFAYAITQFGITVKTDIDNYKEDFFTFLKGEGM